MHNVWCRNCLTQINMMIISAPCMPVLESDDETIRSHATDALFNFYLLKQRYDKAEKYLKYFSSQEPVKKMKQAQLYGKTNHEASSLLDIATVEQDADTVIATMKEMLSGIGQIGSFYQSPLFGHMEFKEMRESSAEIKITL